MPRENKKHPYDFGYLLTFFLLLLLAGAAILLLLPSYRDYRAKKRESVKLERDLEALKGERDERLREVNDDLRLLRMMVDGSWNDKEFLILQPGERIAPDYTGRKLKAVRISAD